MCWLGLMLYAAAPSKPTAPNVAMVSRGCLNGNPTTLTILSKLIFSIRNGVI